MKDTINNQKLKSDETIGYTHGRYQPFHKGHYLVIEKMLKTYDKVYIGIANPDRELPSNLELTDKTLIEDINKARAPENNLYSYEERRDMIYASLKEAGYDMSRIIIQKHYGFYDTDNWEQYLPPKEQTTIIMPIKDTHHSAKKDLYEEQGYKVKVIPLFPGYSGKKLDAAIEKYIETGSEEWKELVPNAVQSYIENKILQNK